MLLHSFRCKNYRCFREEAKISFELDKNTPVDERSVESLGKRRLSKAMVIVGPNGGGKTTLLNALVFVGDFITESFSAKPGTDILLEPHFEGADKLSEFTVVFDWDQATWIYQLSATKKQVHTESLHRKTHHKSSYIFKRKWNHSAATYDIKQNRTQCNHPLDKVSPHLRKNVSLIATACQQESPFFSRLVTSLEKSSTNLSYYGLRKWQPRDINDVAKFYTQYPSTQSKMTTLLKQWDLGLNDVDIEKRSLENYEDQYIPFGAHKTEQNTHWLNFHRESSGTQTAFLLLSKLLPALEKGGVAVIDELEAHLHPHMLIPILELFFSPDTNPYHAQLIFTSHSLEILNELHKGQILLVEKNRNNESHVWRLDAIRGVRPNENFCGKYTAGAYGGIPNLQTSNE